MAADQRPNTVEGVLNKSYDPTYDTLVFQQMEYDPAGAVKRSVTPSLTYAFENDANGNPIYIGRAAIGTAKSAASWQIRKLTWSGSSVTDIQWAGGSDAFTNIWDNRASLSYS